MASSFHQLRGSTIQHGIKLGRKLEESHIPLLWDRMLWIKNIQRRVASTVDASTSHRWSMLVLLLLQLLLCVVGCCRASFFLRTSRALSTYLPDYAGRGRARLVQNTMELFTPPSHWPRFKSHLMDCFLCLYGSNMALWKYFIALCDIIRRYIWLFTNITKYSSIK